MSRPLLPVDAAQRLLKTLGWGFGDAAFRDPNGALFWQVDCRRDEHTIIARAGTQRDAWNAALAQAGKVQRD